MTILDDINNKLDELNNKDIMPKELVCDDETIDKLRNIDGYIHMSFGEVTTVYGLNVVLSERIVGFMLR